MNEVVAVIAALAGTSGLASIIAGGSQFRRTHRLQSQLKEIDAATKLVTPGSREAGALNAALASSAMELSAYILIKHDVRRLIALGLALLLVSGVALIFFGTVGAAGFDSASPLFGSVFTTRVDTAMVAAGGITIGAAYVSIYVYAYLRITARSRQSFIDKLCQQGNDGLDSEMVLKLAREDSTSERASRPAQPQLPTYAP